MTTATRTASSFPDLEGVDTPLGPCEYVWATSSTHIGMRGTFTINRVAYQVRLDLHYRDGQWQEGDKDTWESKWHALMIDREWDYPNGKRRPDTSSAARTKAHDALVPWLASFAVNDGAEIVREAGILDHSRRVAQKEAEIRKLREEIEASEAELRELVNQ